MVYKWKNLFHCFNTFIVKIPFTISNFLKKNLTKSIKINKNQCFEQFFYLNVFLLECFVESRAT